MCPNAIQANQHISTNPDRGSFLSRVPIPGTGPESHGYPMVVVSSKSLSLAIIPNIVKHQKMKFHQIVVGSIPQKTDVRSWIIQHAPTCFPPKQPIQTSPLCGLNHLTISICVTKHCEVKMQPFPIWNITIQGPPVSTRLCPNNVCWFLIPFKFIYSWRVSTGVTPWLIMPYL